MIIKTLKQHWTAAEIIAEVERRTGKVAGVTVGPGEITLGMEDLPDHERIDLETYFGAEHDLPTVAEKASKEELVARVRKFTNGSEISMNAKDIRDALGALAELAGIKL